MGCSCSPLFLGRCWTSTSINISQSPTIFNNSNSKRTSILPSLTLFRLCHASKDLQTGAMLCFNASLETNASCNKELTIIQRKLLPFDFPLGSGGNWNNNNNNNNNPIDPWWWNDGSDSSESHFPFIWFLCWSVVFWVFINLHLASSALAKATFSPEEEEVVDEKVWEIKGSKWIRLIPDFFKDEFLVAPSSSGPSHDNRSPSWLSIGGNLWLQCRALFIQLMLPEGFPLSVTSDYLDYSLWRGIQGVASQISGVLATQALLYAVGLGKGAIPTAAAINWVLKDGIGYLSKIILSKYGRHFDVNPKGWRLFADLLENAAFGLEILTPAFPHLFVVIGAAAGAGRSAAALIQAATRSCFYAGFAAQRNFAEVIAKGEAQGMVSKFIGIMLGIALANGLVFSEYLLSGQAPPIKEVNDEEPLFPALPFLNVNCKDKPQSAVLSSGARDAAAEIEKRLQLGSKLSEIVKNKDEVLALFNLYRDEGYILTEHKGRFCVVLKESCSGQDMLKAVFQVNYLYWLERNAGIEARGTCADCRPGGRLQISLEYTQWEFTHVKNDSVSMGWVADGLIARPLPNRIGPGDMAPSIAS